jgi:hypothetical protein
LADICRPPIAALAKDHEILKSVTTLLQSKVEHIRENRRGQLSFFDCRRPFGLRLPMVMAVLLTCAACAGTVQEQPQQMAFAPTQGVDRTLLARAIDQANSLRARGQRVWCVPFARNASGIEIRGNANTWWDQASGEFDRGHQPRVGAVMAFSGTRSLPRGHVAVVSKVISAREIEIDHANWERNRISLGMKVVDVSEANDWSAVRVESTPGQLGRTYPVDGFIFRGQREI